MNCIRYIKLKTIKANRKSRRLYTDDKGRFTDMKHITKFHHEKRKLVPKGDNRRRQIYG